MHHKLFQTVLFLVGAVLINFSVSQPVQSAQCVNVSLLDANGVIVPTDEPVVGMMLGGVPAIQGEFPPHVGTRAGNEVPCPQIIMDQVTTLFTQTCTTMERRTAAAQEYGVDMSIIVKGCADMNEALNKDED